MTSAQDRRPLGVSGRIRVAAAVISIGVAFAGCGSSSHPSTTATTTGADKLVQQGVAEARAGNTDAAIASYNQAVKLNPRDKLAYYDLAVLHQQKGDVASARNAYQQALQIDPNYASALFNLAILDTPTDPNTAVSTYRKLLTLRPNDANVLFNLGLLLERLGNKAEGSADIGKAIKINPALAKRIPPTTAGNATPTTR